ncbi:MAG: AbrB/MazE/SpoVT family DNA-binding domain-containing protein [Rhizobiales bacterium]|nr:AbrB/MazE/SpoVT family DNA-binding domain-containing protein [Hyphomicrobiales bacterium]MBI3672124.1 AbrB/MazE/SpoVT family DNA-binding domain-containing protein [Hyphomicrobiales bacterium]
MRWLTKVDRRGRVTLPKTMRDELGIKPGDGFDFGIAEKGRVVVTRRSDGLSFLLVVPDREAA